MLLLVATYCVSVALDTLHLCWNRFQFQNTSKRVQAVWKLKTVNSIKVYLIVKSILL